MNDAVILQQVNAGSEYVELVALVFARTMRYCQYHKIDYHFYFGDLWKAPNGADWGKLKMIRDAMERYEYVVWLDADAFIWNVTWRLTEALKGHKKPVAMCVYTNPMPHYQVGVMYWRSTDQAKKMMDEWIATFPGDTPWNEQATFNQLAAETWPEGVVQVLGAEWNCTEFINPHPAPIIVATHGYTGVQPRMDRFRRALDNWRHPSPMEA